MCIRDRSSTSGLVITITAIGLENSENLIKRNGAKPNDLLVVTGDLGGAYMWLQILEREHAVYLANPNMQPEMEGYDYILERQLKPEARTDIKKILEELDIKPVSYTHLDVYKRQCQFCVCRILRTNENGFYDEA